MPEKNTDVPTLIKDTVVFKELLIQMVHEEVADMQQLLVPGEWKVGDDFVQAMQGLTEQLGRAYVYRASLFGTYRREDANTKKKNKEQALDLREDDFALGWKTLEQDAAGK